MSGVSNWPKLLGIPHQAGAHDADSGFLDCAGVVRTLYRWGGLLLSRDDVVNAHSGRWENVGTDTAKAKVLDVVGSDPESVGAVTHLSCVVAAGYRGAALTSSKRHGVILQKNWGIANVVGIYRLQS